MHPEGARWKEGGGCRAGVLPWGGGWQTGGACGSCAEPPPPTLGSLFNGQPPHPPQGAVGCLEELPQAGIGEGGPVVGELGCACMGATRAPLEMGQCPGPRADDTPPQPGPGEGEGGLGSLWHLEGPCVQH